jgi:hypothetical protein
MAFSPSEFAAQLTGGGVRSNLFEFRLTFPNSLVANSNLASSKITFMAKAATLPASSVPSVAVPYFGRHINVAGDRTFAPMNITVIMDEDYLVRNAFEVWSNAVKGHESNLNTAGSPSHYKIDCEVIQYGKDGSVNKTYKLVGVYPTDIAEVQLNWDSNNSVAEFPVTLAMDYWTSNTTS